ncbi:MAG: hypothetical protein ABI589_14935, partial [Burkholderiales bacterium]
GLAQVEGQAGRWRRSVQLYREAAALSGGDPVLAEAAAAVDREHGSNVRLDAEHRESHGGDIVSPVTIDLGGIKAMARINEAWRMSLGVEAASVHTAAVRRTSGALQPFSGHRERIDFSLQHDALDGAVTVGSMFGGGGTVGLGLLRRQPDDWGSTSGTVEYHRLNWDYIEGIVDRAWRDRIAVARNQRFGGGLTGRADLGLNRYGFSGNDSVGRSSTASAELRYTGLAGVAGLSVAYGLDAEYVQRLDSYRTSTGLQFEPLPLRDREVHIATLGYSRSFGERLGGGAFSVNGYAGAGKDRFGGSGPIAALALGWARGAFSAQLRASHVRNIGRSRGTTDSIGAWAQFQF